MFRVWMLSLAAGATLLAAAVYLPPMARPGVPPWLVRELPGAVAGGLVARGCNLVRGHGVASADFTGAGQRDWAVLCQQGHQASLMIYTAGRGTPAVLGTHGGGLVDDPEAARGIRSVEWDYVVRHNPGLRGRSAPKACVEDGVGMGSSIYCFLNGEWVGLTGAD